MRSSTQSLFSLWYCIHSGQLSACHKHINIICPFICINAFNIGQCFHDIVIKCNPVSSQDLPTPFAYLSHSWCYVGFRHGNLTHWCFLLVGHLGYVVGVPYAGLQVWHDFDNFLLHELEGQNGFAKLVALGAVLDYFLVNTHSKTYCNPARQ